MADSTEARKLIHTEQGRKWLAQFDPLDQEIATAIANNLTLVSHNEFERNLVCLQFKAPLPAERRWF